MSKGDRTCEFVLDPDDPEMWGGKEGDYCHVDREFLDEDDLWHCPHDVEETASLCIFHQPTDEKDDANVVKSFLQVCQNLNSGTGSESKNQIFGAKLKNFDISGENIENGDVPILLNHCRFLGDTNFSEVTITGPMFLRGSQFYDDVDFSEAKLRGGLSLRSSIFEGSAKFDETIFQDADFAGVFSSSVVFTNDASFLGTVFKGKCDFSGAVFESDTGFVGCVFRDLSRFNQAKFIGSVDFSETVFDSDQVSFSEANFGDKPQFDGVDLTDANLSDVTLDCGGSFRETNFTDAKLTNSTLSGSNFERSKFSRANLFGTQLDGCAFYGGIFGDSQINEETEFGSRCVYDTEYDTEPAADFDSERTNRLTKAAGQYRIIEQLARTNAFPDMVSKNFIRRQNIHREQHRERGRWGRWFRATASKYVLEYGENPWRLIATGLIIVVGFGLLYPLVGGIKPIGGSPITASRVIEDPLLLAQSIYYSTLTFTTLGMGDFQPTGLGRILTTLETSLGAIIVALLVFVFGRRAAR